MRTAAELVADLEGRGVVLHADGGRLRFTAPAGAALPPALRAELARRKAEVVPLVAAAGAPAGDELAPLFTAVSLGSLRLANRIVVSPMEVDLGEPGGEAGERAVAYYAARAAGGAGLVVIEATAVEWPRGGISPVQLRADDDRFVPSLARLARAVRRAGVPAVLQLQHAGRKTSALVTGEKPVAPSAVASHRGETPRALAAAEIEALIAAYAAAAVRAQAAGFDGVEIHAAHGYLVSQFLSPLYNRRDDEWGGDLAGRARFLRRVVAAVVERVGAGYPVLCRLSAADLEAAGEIRPHPDGLSLEEAVRVAGWLEADGVAGLDVSATLVGAPRMHPMSWPEAHLAPYAAAVRRHLSVPVSMTSRVPPPRAARLVAAGELDLVRFGRALLADPDLPRKLAAGDAAAVRPCVYCGVCTDAAWRRPEAVCAVNPGLGREAEDDLAPAAVPRRVVVVGGGPAGLEAARVAALRGHRVVLYEAAPELGGGLRGGSASPAVRATLEALRRHLAAAVAAAGVEVRLGHALTAGEAAALEADAAVLATGARPAVPALAGLPSDAGGAALPDGVVFAADLLAAAEEALPPPPPGGRAVVVGAGRVGCEAALALAGRGWAVTLVGRRPDVAPAAVRDLRAYFDWALAAHGVERAVPAQAEEVAPGRVALRDAGGRRTVACELVVLATGAVPAAELETALAARCGRVVRAGDCRQPRHLQAAIEDGYVAGREL